MNDTGHGIIWCLTFLAHEVGLFTDDEERAYRLRCDAQNLAFLAGLHRACGLRPSVVAIAALIAEAGRLDGGAFDS